MNPAPIFLVVGAPAVGKSTVSRALARRFERSVHIPVPVRPYLDEGIELVYGLYGAAGEQLDREGWLVIDNADLSPDETAARIVEETGLNSATIGAR